MNKNPWETKEGKAIWKTEATYWTWLRGALRRLWKDYPLRQQWKKNSLRPVTKEERIAKKYHPSTKNVGQCSMCGEWMAGSKLECDHKIESKGCTSRETAESFLWHCGGLVGDDFRLACKPCHKIQSYSQKQNITFEEATIQKKAIEILKDSKKCLTWFKERSILYPSNAKLRREAIIKYLEEYKDDTV